MTEKDLRNEFKEITGDNWINSQGEPDIDYVSFLETRLIKNHGVIGHVSVTSDGYTISNHPDLASRKVIWLEGPEGDGTTVELKNVFEWAM